MEKKKILIIEDDRSLRESYKLIFSFYSNVEIFEAEDGDKGFETAKFVIPDLIILDNKMPVMSGEQTARLLRGEPTTKNIPIVMTTGMQLLENDVNLIKLDVNEFVRKPVNQWEFKKIIEKYVGPLIEETLL